MAKRPPTKTPKKKLLSATARKARARAQLAAARPPVETHSPRDLVAVIADQAKVIVEQMALIAVLRRPAADTVVRRIVLKLLDLLAHAAIDHEVQLRDLVTEARGVLDTDGTRSDTVSADVAVRAIAERDQLKRELDDVREELATRVAMSGADGPERFARERDELKTEYRAHVGTLTAERDAARDTLAGIADHAGLQNWQTATPEGLRAILRAVQDLRRSHNERVVDLQRVERDKKLYENALCRIAALIGAEGMDGDMDAGRAQLVLDAVTELQRTHALAVDDSFALRSLQTTQRRFAEVLAALEFPALEFPTYDPATTTDAAHAELLARIHTFAGDFDHMLANIRTADAERAQALDAKRTADALLTLATQENAELRRQLLAKSAGDVLVAPPEVS